MYEMVVAVCKDFGIGRNKSIPWNIREDMIHFKNLTINNIVIMGRKTFFSIPEKNRPLIHRFNIILTNNPEKYSDFNSQNVVFIKKEDIEQYIKNENKRIFIIGGQSLYNLFLNKTYKIHMTIIDKKFECDARFPLIDNNFIIESYSDNHYSNEEKCYYHFITLIKNIYNHSLKNYFNLSDCMINKEEDQYLKILSKIIKKGHKRNTRNGIVYSIFGEQMSFNLEHNYPLLTTKKMFLRGIFEELKFFLLGKTDTKILEDKGITIWKNNTDTTFLKKNNLPYQEGDMGPMYGFQWLHFNASYNGCERNYEGMGLNQIEKIIDLLIHDRFSRRIIMTTLNPLQADLGVLYPCHGLIVQFGIQNNNELCCHMHQRSGDFFLGVPFNIASYALLTSIICNIVNNNVPSSNEKLILGKLTISFGDCHIYESHLEAVEKQLKRIPNPFPSLKISKELYKLTDIEELSYTDLLLSNYIHYPPIKAEMIA